MLNSQFFIKDVKSQFIYCGLLSLINYSGRSFREKISLKISTISFAVVLFMRTTSDHLVRALITNRKVYPAKIYSMKLVYEFVAMVFPVISKDLVQFFLGFLPLIYILHNFALFFQYYYRYSATKKIIGLSFLCLQFLRVRGVIKK